MATALGIKPDSRKVFQYRLFSLMTDGGALVSRKVFTEYATKMSGSVSEHLENYKPAIQQSFLQRRINREQYSRLFPDQNPAVTVDTCDVTLLAFLVNVTCVEETDDEVLNNKITYVDKLRLFRNKIVHAPGTEEHDERTFEELWEKIKDVIMIVGQGMPGLEEEIDKLKDKPIDPGREKKLQNMITDLEENAAVAKDLEKTIIAKMTVKMNTLKEEIVTKIDEDGDKRDEKEKARDEEHVSRFNAVHDHIDEKGYAFIENQKVLINLLKQIIIDPSRQLPYPGDFGPDSPISLKALQASSSCEKKGQLKQLEGPLGMTCGTRDPKVLTKVTDFDKSDYEDLTKAISNGWPTVASHLGLSKSQIDGIRAKFERNENQAYIEEMVLIWGKRENEHATIERFINTVVECPMMEVERTALEGILGRYCIKP